MIRIIDFILQDWKNTQNRKPLLIRGARQVGKTYSVRTLAKGFDDFVEINFETMPDVIKIFEHDLDAERILKELGLYLGKKIEPGKTLLFLDEAQVFPRAIISLRYFYEQIPNLHVICAGSLLDFAIHEVGVPVGRISFLYMYPLSFAEFLLATGHKLLLKEVMKNSQKISSVLHEKTMRHVHEYLAVGGMPEAVQSWIEHSDPQKVSQIHSDLVTAFMQDFTKYAKKNQIPYVTQIFKSIPHMIGKKFKFSEVSGEYRKRELQPALELLVSANIVHKVFHSHAQNVPLGGQSDFDKFKLILLDISLMQHLLGWKAREWIVGSLEFSGIKGAVIEAFIGQELLAYSDSRNSAQLFYWHRESKSSNAEVDYVISQERDIVPIEVKSGVTGKLKSMSIFLQEHTKNSSKGIRFSTGIFEDKNNIKSLPLYAVIALFAEQNPALQELVMCNDK